jgi:putative endonuclease
MTTQIGNQAEDIAARYLEEQRFKVLARNWHNRWCEIDVVARSKDKTVHFVEVKYRSSTGSGQGFDYITVDKQQRLQRAAVMWMTEQKLDAPFQIDVISVDGDLTGPEITYIPNAIEL